MSLRMRIASVRPSEQAEPKQEAVFLLLIATRLGPSHLDKRRRMA